jgi:hypothetical protein
MAKIPDIKIKFSAKGAPNLIRAIKTLDRSTKALINSQARIVASNARQNHSNKKLGAGILGLNGKQRLLNNSFATLRSKMLLASFAAGIFTVTIGKLVKSQIEQEKAEKKLSQALKSTGHSAGLSHRQLLLMASALQTVTTHGDETIIGAQALMLTFTNINKEVFPQALESILNVSDAMGQDLKQSTIQIGKALNDPIQGMSALRRIGIQLSDTQKQQVTQFMAVNDVASAQKIIIEELDAQFGGMARSTRLTLAGSLTALGNAWGDALERMGETLTPFISTLSDALKGLTSIMMSEGERQLQFLEEIGASEETLQIARIRLLKEETQERANAIDGLDINLNKHETLLEVYQAEETRLVALRNNLKLENKALDESSQKLLGIAGDSASFNNALETLSNQTILTTAAQGGYSVGIGDYLALQDEATAKAAQDVLTKKEQAESTQDAVDKQIAFNISLGDYLRSLGLIPDFVTKSTEATTALIKIADIAKLAMSAFGDALVPGADVGDSFKKFINGYLSLIQSVIIASGAMSGALNMAWVPGLGVAASIAALAALEVAKAGVQNVKFAEHGFNGFVNEPTLFMTGEGNKREHVSITPLESPNLNGASGSTTNVYIQGGIVQEDYIRNELIPAINRSGVGVA